MRTVRFTATGLLLLGILVASVVTFPGVQRVAAQNESQRFTSPLTGQVIQTSGSWTIDSAALESGDGFEFVPLYGQTDGMMLAFLPAGTDLVSARDIFLDEFAATFDTIVPIDRGAYGNVSYSLDMTSSEGVEFGMFSLFLGQRESGYVEYNLYFAPVMVFQQSMVVAQQSVTVGGENVFEGVDPAGLQSLLSANEGVTGATSDVSETNVVETSTEAPIVPTAPSTGSTTTDGAAYLQTLRTELAALQTTLDDFIINFAGLQSDDPDSAIAEINRVSAVWTGYPEEAASIDAPAGFEDIDASYQTLAQDVGSMGESWNAVVEAIRADDQAGISQAVDDFISIMDQVQAGIDALNMTIDSADASTNQAPVSDPTPRPTEASAATEKPTDLTDVSGTSSSRGGMSLGGSMGEKNETETGNSGETGDLTLYEDLGLLTEGDYVSPQHDVRIRWDDAWYFNTIFEDLLRSDTESGIDSLPITWAGGDTVYIMSSVGTGDGLVPTDMTDYWTTDEYLAESADPGATILLNQSSRSGSAGIMMRDYLDDGTEVVIIKVAMCPDTDCELLLISTMFAMPEEVADAYADARSGIEVDGERIFDVFTSRDVSRALND